MERNLTTGSVFKNIVIFSLPYFLSYFLQTLYGLADLFIIGQYEGVASTTAVSVGSQVMHMLTVMIVGLAMGTTVSIGRAVGAGDKKRMSACVGNTVTLFMLVSVVLTAALVLLVDPIVSVMSTPAEAVDGTARYLTVCFIGIPFITAYNIISSIFRGMGDSKSPMYFIAVACAANIALDYLFMGAMRLGPVGAALGTTLAQAISVLVAFIAIRRRRSVAVSRADLRPRCDVMGQILGIGVPVALQDGLIQIAFILITVIANLRGLTDSAAVGIVEKLISFLFLVPSSMLSTVSAIGAQNIGAGDYGRAKQTMWYAIGIAVGFGVIVSVLFQFISEPVVGLFTPDEGVILPPADSICTATSSTVCLQASTSASADISAPGKSMISFIHNISGVALVRVPGAYLMSKMYPATLLPMGLATAAGSILQVLICIVAYRIICRRGKDVHALG